METKFSLEIVLSTLRSLWGGLKWVVSKIPLAIWKVAGIAILVLLGSSITTVVLNRLTRPEVVHGGVDLQSYCENYNYNTVDMTGKNAICLSSIDLDEACKWQYAAPGMKFELQDPDSAYSGVCYDSENRPLGGISNMSGFCKHLRNSGSPSAVVVNKARVCRLTVNVDVACSLQYNNSDVKAKFEESEWLCYS